MADDLKIKVSGDTTSVEQSMKRAAAATDRYKDSLLKLEIELEKAATEEKLALEKRLKKQEDAAKRLGTGMLAAGTAIGIGLGLASKAAIDWESAWAGVTKVTSGTPAQMAALEGELRNLAKTLPASHDEIAAVAEAAGQLGVRRADIAQFTKVMVEMGVSTNLTADAAATGMARFSNVMGEPIKNVDRLGATIVGLGNNGASTEQDILDMSLRIAGAGKTAGFTSAQVLSVANALSSLGIEAEAGGSSISTVMAKIDKAVGTGGDLLTDFAKVSGMSAEQFSAQWKSDPSKALLAFESGLSKAKDSGANLFEILGRLGITEIRQRAAVLALANGHDVLADSLRTGEKAWEQNSALVNEANKRFDTTASRMQVARNQIDDLGISLGQTLLPMIGAAADAGIGFVEFFDNLPGPVKTAVVVLGTLATTVGVLGGGFLVLAPRIREAREMLATLGGVSGTARKGLGGVTSMLGGPWGIAIAAGVTALGYFVEKSVKAAEAARQLEDTLDDQTGALTDNTRAAVAKSLADAGILDKAQRLGISLSDVTSAALGQKAALDRVNDALDANMHAAGAAGGPHSRLAVDVKAVHDAVDGENTALGRAIKQKKQEIEATKGASDAEKAHKSAAEGAAGATFALGDSAETAAQKAADLKQAVDDLKTSLDLLNGESIAAEEATIAFNDQIRAMKQEVKDNGESLKANTKAGDANRKMLLDGIQAAKTSADAIFDKTQKEKGNEAAVRAANDVMATSIRRLRDEAIHLGLTKGQVDKYIAAQLGISPKEVTKYESPGLASALADARALDAKADALDGRTVTLTTIQKKFIQDVHTGPSHFGNATGGLIDPRFPGGVRFRGGMAGGGYTGPVYGPGTGTSDTAGIYALSNGEYVNRASTVDRLGVDFFRGLDSGVVDLGRIRSAGRLGGTAPATAGGGGTDVAVSVYLGNREITDIVRTEVRETNRDLRRRVMAGTGGAR